MLIPALGIAFVGIHRQRAHRESFRAQQGQAVDANQELRALGAGQHRRRLSHGFPISCSGSRTALGAAVGSRTQLYSLVTLVLVAAGMLVARVLAQLPEGGAGRTGDLRGGPADRRGGDSPDRPVPAQRIDARAAPRSPCSALGVLYGVLVAVALSIVDLLRRVARPHDSVLGYVPGVAGMHDVDDYPTRAGARAGGLPLRRAVVFRQRRGLPPPRTGRGR